MTWSAPSTFSVSQIVTAAIMNSDVRDNLRYLKGLDGAVQIDNDLTAVLAAGGSLTAQGTSNASYGRIRMLSKRASSAVVDWRIISNGISDAGELVFYDAAAGSERARLDSAGNVGIGSTAPQGRLHVGNASGQGGFLQYGYSGLGGGTTTVLPAAAVTAGFAVSYVTKPSAGAINGSTTFLSTAGGSVNLFTDGGTNVFTLNYVVGGSVTLTRTAGALTYAGTFTLVYY